MELKEHFNSKIFALISETADELGLECYVVGGYVRDIFLNRPSKDIDVVVVESIDINVSGMMPNGDPAPKRDPKDGGKKTMVGMIFGVTGCIMS